jgi:hypothetical protein
MIVLMACLSLFHLLPCNPLVPYCTSPTLFSRPDPSTPQSSRRVPSYLTSSSALRAILTGDRTEINCNKLSFGGKPPRSPMPSTTANTPSLCLPALGPVPYAAAQVQSQNKDHLWSTENPSTSCPVQPGWRVLFCMRVHSQVSRTQCA